MNPQTFTLTDLPKKGKAAEAVFQAPEGWVCTLEPPHRSLNQNSLQHKWWSEIAQQRGDMTEADVKAEAKAYFGVPILLAENNQFREKYEAKIKHLPTATKLDVMHLLPVSSLMNKDQHRRYLDAVFQFYTSKGFSLTVPEDKS